jgi:hypothetical protein
LQLGDPGVDEQLIVPEIQLDPPFLHRSGADDGFFA